MKILETLDGDYINLDKTLKFFTTIDSNSLKGTSLKKHEGFMLKVQMDSEEIIEVAPLNLKCSKHEFKGPDDTWWLVPGEESKYLAELHPMFPTRLGEFFIENICLLQKKDGLFLYEDWTFDGLEKINKLLIEIDGYEVHEALME